MSDATPIFESLEAMDLELARLARLDGVLRVGLGVGLEVLARLGGHHELGFASVEAYALERCERSARWVQASRSVARRLEALPAIHGALLAGEISFSMAQELVRVARVDDELVWLTGARTRTVREMHVLARAPGECPAAEGAPGSPASETESEAEAADVAADGRESVALTISTDREDAWFFECARMIAHQVAGMTETETMEALLGEGTTSLLGRVRRDDFALVGGATDDVAQQQWEAQLSRWREEAEVRCEAKVKANERRRPTFDGDARCVFDGHARAVDAQLRQVASELSKRDLALGRAAEVFWRLDGWRRLGYATSSQYARERLGMSLSSVKAKRRLARRAEELPGLSNALEQGEIGYEAARLVALVATPETVGEWVERAAERTVRHLREEIDAAQVFARLAPGWQSLPPDAATMHELAAVESRIVSGAALRAANEGQISAGRAEPLATIAGARRRSSAGRHRGRVTLRFRLHPETRHYYRWLERLFERHGPTRMSFLRFLCEALLDTWKHTLGSDAKYAQVYGRDRYRCSSPVCGRRGVTPHHLKFRSAGGDDSAENVASLCVWCHLEGIHGGTLRARPPASDIEWSIGRTEHTRVRGRRRMVVQCESGG